jgi:ribosomal-protein-alanine N-acetyltransferase
MPDLQDDPDPAQLAAVDAQCFADVWDGAAYARLLDNPAVRARLLRDDAGTPAGLLCWQRVADELELYRIAVVPARRGRGLGLWLLERLLDEARQAGVRRVHLEVRAGNVAARRLYAKAGFAEVGCRPGYYREPTEDALLCAWEPAGRPHA